MQNSPRTSLYFWISKIPLFVKTTVCHVLRLSKTSRYWNLSTALNVGILDYVINQSPAGKMSDLQKLGLIDYEITGKIWVSKVTFPVPPEDSIRQVLFNVIEGMKETGEAPGGYHEPSLSPVEAEWTGYRGDATRNSPEPKISEAEKYEKLMQEVKSKTTILYMHGGAFCVLDPATHRPTTQILAKLTKGRCLSIRYRLSPQNPFPAALLDSFFAYLSLLYPPPDSFHTPVSPSHIVFAGDSAGGNLCFSLLQLISEIQRRSLKIEWHGVERDVPIPAGIATSSPWFDLTCSLSSIKDYGSFDYLPKHKIDYPACSIWPTVPPRRSMYVNDSIVSHPLVSPITAKNWSGSCPIYISTGWELLTNEDLYAAMKIARQGGQVILEQYEAMPHCFGLILPKMAESKKFFDSWAHSMTLMVEYPEDIVTSATLIKAKTLKKQRLDIQNLSKLTEEEIMKKIREKMSNNLPGGFF